MYPRARLTCVTTRSFKSNTLMLRKMNSSFSSTRNENRCRNKNERNESKMNKNNNNGTHKKIIVGLICVVILVVYQQPILMLTHQYMRNLEVSSSSSLSLIKVHEEEKVVFDTENFAYSYCSYRNYGTQGLYGMSLPNYPTPNFLRKSLYIHGKQPILLPTIPLDDFYQYQNQPHKSLRHRRFGYKKSTTSSSGKLCFDYNHYGIMANINGTKMTATTSSSSSSLRSRRMMIATPEGTNPTLISFERILQSQPYSSSTTLTTNTTTITSSSSFQDGIRAILQDYPTAAYIVSTTSKNVNHQCGSSVVQHDEATLTLLPPVGFHVNVLIVDIHMNTLLQTIVQVVNGIEEGGDEQRRHPLVGDDARLFLHNGDDDGGFSLWMNYKRYDLPKNGPLAFASQLKLEYDNNKKFQVTTMPGKDEDAAIKLCCGRNFAVVPPPQTKPLSGHSDGKLSFLTSPDPVWVQEVDTNINFRRISHQLADPPRPQRKHHQSFTPSFHGTSSTLLYLPNTKEYLGIGHIHREAGYSGVGHHYTHAFFTISDTAPYTIIRLSGEFVFESKYAKGDADSIQFSTGLKWVPTIYQDEGRRTAIAIGYGIMDCESSVICYVGCYRFDVTTCKQQE